jgi:hypothetical protein
MAASDETNVALTRRLPPDLDYELEQISKIDILRKMKRTLRRKDDSRHPFPN